MHALQLQLCIVSNTRCCAIAHEWNLDMSVHNDEVFYDGFIYLLVNPSLPNWVKIGLSKNPEERIKKLATANPTPFVIYHAWTTDNMRAAERICHKLLDSHRAASRREFFDIRTGVVIQTYMDDYYGEEYEIPSWPVDELADYLELEVQRHGVMFERAYFS